MARKKKKALTLEAKQQKVPAKRINWSFEETIELIAWLNHAVKHKANNFDDTVVSHLQQACDADFTIKQVWKKLEALWKNIGQDKYPHQKGWRDVFDHGSKIFKLTDEELDSIALAQKKIEEEATTTLLETPRRTRGDSRPGDSRISPFFSLETVLIGPKRQQDSPKVRDGSNVSPVPTGGTKRVASHDKREFSPSKRPKKASPFKSPVISTDNTPQEKDSSREEKPNKLVIHTADGNTVRGGSEEDLLQQGGMEDAAGPAGAPERQQVQDSEQSDDTMDVADVLLLDAGSDSDISSHADSLDQANIEFKSGASAAISFETAWHKRLDAATDKIKTLQQQVLQQRSTICLYKKHKGELEEEIKLLREAQTERDRNIGKGFEATIEEKNRYIREKISELNDRRILGRFTKFSLNSLAICGETSIATTFNDIYVETRNILHQYNSQKLPLESITSLKEETDLHILLRKVVDTNSVLMEDIKLILSKLKLPEIIRLVTMSALREWVFEGDFPQLAEPSSELFEQYRESIGKLDGALALRNLDLAAHASIITSEKFRTHRIPKLAKELAKRLSRALAPLFVNEYPDHIQSDLDGFSTWGQEQDIYEKRRTRLKTIFERALTAKADSLLNLEEYKIVVYPPGTKFKHATMVAEKTQGTEQYRDKPDGGSVDLCIEAAVFSYPKRKLGGDGPSFITDALVQPRNFSQASNVHREGGKLLVKARVFLRDSQHALCSSVGDSMSADEGSG